jgi:hypothetical protein
MIPSDLICMVGALAKKQRIYDSSSYSFIPLSGEEYST